MDFRSRVESQPVSSSYRSSNVSYRGGSPGRGASPGRQSSRASEMLASRATAPPARLGSPGRTGSAPRSASAGRRASFDRSSSYSAARDNAQPSRAVGRENSLGNRFSSPSRSRDSLVSRIGAFQASRSTAAGISPLRSAAGASPLRSRPAYAADPAPAPPPPARDFGGPAATQSSSSSRFAPPPETAMVVVSGGGGSGGGRGGDPNGGGGGGGGANAARAAQREVLRVDGEWEREFQLLLDQVRSAAANPPHTIAAQSFVRDDRLFSSTA